MNDLFAQVDERRQVSINLNLDIVFFCTDLVNLQCTSYIAALTKESSKIQLKQGIREDHYDCIKKC